MAYITTIPLFKNTLAGTGGTSLSDPIDLRNVSKMGDFTMAYGIASTNGGGAGTSGSTVWEYLGCSVFAGTYVSLGTFGTFGNGPAQAGVVSFTPPAIPFMKIQAVCGTSGPALLTAELHVR